MKRFLVASVLIVAGCNAPASKPTPEPSQPHLTISEVTSTSAAVEGGRVKLLEAANDTDALTLIRTRRLEAKAESRVLVVYVGAKWCEPCRRFKAELDSGRLDARLGKVTLLMFDVDKDGDRLSAAGYSYRFIPFVGLPGADGQPTDTTQAAGKGGDAWRELLAKLDTWQRS